MKLVKLFIISHVARYVVSSSRSNTFVCLSIFLASTRSIKLTKVKLESRRLYPRNMRTYFRSTRLRQTRSSENRQAINSLRCYNHSVFDESNNIQVKALANEDTQLRTHCCRHKYFPVCPRAQHLLRTQILCPGNKNVSDFVQKHFVAATNVSQFAQLKKHHGQQCVRNNVSSFTRAFYATLTERENQCMNWWRTDS